MPYSTAATCLHMPAQSGQLHESSISSGEGNRPWFCRQIRSMTPLDNRPCSNSTSESIAPAQSLPLDFHSPLGTTAWGEPARGSRGPPDILEKEFPFFFPEGPPFAPDLG